MKRPLIVITGPTASGKSKLSIRLAKDIDGEIVSADSIQVYKGMDIGTDKIRPEETEGIVHHMIDVADPHTSFSIAEYCTMAKRCIDDILSRGKMPIVAGGTGFYIHALLYDTDFGENDSGGEIRKKYQDILEEKGIDYLFNMLKEEDPESAISIHPNNKKRVIRALEYKELTGEKMSQHNKEESEKESPYNFLYIALNVDRDTLYEKIDARVDKMMENGLYEEVQRLRSEGLSLDYISMQAIGYKELIDTDDIEKAVEEIKQNSRHYAKRQFTWIKREKNVTWIDSPVKEEDYNWILKECMRISDLARES